jgi:hypothetical protein
MPCQAEVWLTAAACALAFWDSAAGDVRIGKAFRAICSTNARRLRDLVDRV